MKPSSPPARSSLSAPLLWKPGRQQGLSRSFLGSIPLLLLPLCQLRPRACRYDKLGSTRQAEERHVSRKREKEEEPRRTGEQKRGQRILSLPSFLSTVVTLRAAVKRRSGRPPLTLHIRDRRNCDGSPAIDYSSTSLSSSSSSSSSYSSSSLS